MGSMVDGRHVDGGGGKCGQVQRFLVGRAPAIAIRAACAASLLVILPGCGGSQSNTGGGTLADQIQAAKANPNPQSRARELTLLGDKQQKAQDSQGAKTTFRAAHEAIAEIKDPSAKAMELAVLAQGYARAGDLSDARRMVDESRQAAANIAEPILKVSAYTSMAKAMNVAKSPNDAMDLLRDAEDAAAKFDASDPLALQQQIEAYVSIAEGYYGLDRPSSASGMLAKVDALIAKLDSPRDQADALGVVAEAQAKMGLPEAAATFERAVEIARSIPEANSQAHALAEIAMRMSDRAQAAALLEEADKKALEVQDGGLRSEVQEKIRRARR